MHKRLLVFLLLLLSFNVKAATPVQKKPVVKHAPLMVKYDSATINLRRLDQKTLDGYRNDKAFDYFEKDSKNNTSWWDRFWKNFWAFIRRLFSSKRQPGGKQDVSIVQILLTATVVIALIFVIIKLIGGDLANVFSRKSRSISMPYTESLENIHEITFDDEIEKALNQRNYKLAVRLLYLSCLKQLNDAQLIHWQIEKTNSTYIEELTDNDQRQSFGVLTRQFEYIWYGDFPVDERSYQNINTLFMDFKKMLP